MQVTTMVEMMLAVRDSIKFLLEFVTPNFLEKYMEKMTRVLIL